MITYDLMYVSRNVFEWMSISNVCFHKTIMNPIDSSLLQSNFPGAPKNNASKNSASYIQTVVLWDFCTINSIWTIYHKSLT